MLRRALFLLALPLAAAVTDIQIKERIDVPGGTIAYERLAGTVHFAVDPALPANRIVTDIDLAPHNEQGLVEFSADLEVLQPRDPAKGNGTAIVEISNRGGRGLLPMFNLATRGDAYGDRYLLEQGYTLVWVGWQFDVPLNPAGLLRLYAPLAKGITGLVRADFVFDHKAFSSSLADRNHIPYPVLDPADSSLQLTVRDHPEDARRPLPRADWQFAHNENGKPIPDPTAVYMAKGFEPGKIYEIVYKAKNPPIAGLGPAAVRDLTSFLKYGGVDTPLGDSHLKHVIGFGASQSGRFLRTFVYYGFNADEKNRKVFDGVWAHVAGAGRGSFNNRFAQPSRDGHPLLNFFYPTDIFPFTDLDETDRETGITDGLLDTSRKQKAVPKIFYTNGSYEYWGRAAALIHVSPDGKRDAPLAPDTRIYAFAGTQHGANAQPVKHDTANLANPTDYRWQMRALLMAMNQWVTDGTEPPESQYPKIGKDQLVSLAAFHFPAIPGVELPRRLHRAFAVDYGPEFRSKGIVSIEPPKVGKAFPTLIPQVNQDGNETVGIRGPDLAVPLATYTGWNLRAAEIGSPDTIYNMVGSMIPFPRTKAEREKTGDPRLSIEERYKSKADYLEQVAAAANALVSRRLLLAVDVARIVEKAANRWDSITAK